MAGADGRIRCRCHGCATRELAKGSPGECCSMNYVAEPLKQPNQTMAGSSVGLHDLPVHPAHSRETRQHRHWHAVLWVPCCGCRTTSRQSGSAMAIGSAHEGMRRGSPTQRQGRTRASSLPVGRRGGRHLARVAQDRVPLGQGRKLPFLKTLGGHRRYPAAEIRQLADELQAPPTT
jgi:hypothetical protein